MNLKFSLGSRGTLVGSVEADAVVGLVVVGLVVAALGVAALGAAAAADGKDEIII
jgi:hypothetical protein